LGLPYAFAHFINPVPTTAAIEHYQKNFNAGRGRLSAPETILALGVVCAETDEEAERLISSARLFRRRIRQGDLRAIPTVEEALRELGPRPAPMPDESGEWPRYVVGGPDKVRGQLLDMASALHVDELMVVTIVHDHRARMRSYELLAEAFGLRPREND
jgi:alkanesulfonate monooxygenase SsuD/methylene tetrahydromethanopterin reductase-like flavin-dependent oxidoreductase (luciferase family)